MIAPNAAEVLNLVGFVTGTALYAMLLALVLRGSPRGNLLPLATGVLGLVWNLGELAAYALPRLGYFNQSIGLWAMSFPALGLLAAVVVHSVARGLPRGIVITVIAYGCSVAASVLHLQTVITGNPEPSSLAFLILTICYGLIILALGVLTHAQANGQRVLWVLALALFAVSASHLGRFHADADGWAVELIGHHAAIPLAFAILYQDYRFALADLFLKRALTLIALVAVAFAGYNLATTLPAGPLAASILMALWVATSLISPWLHRRVVRFVDQSLLGRMDYAALGAGIGQALQSRNSVEGVLDTVAERLAPALDAQRVWWEEEGAAISAESPKTAQALVKTTDLPRYVVNVGGLTGGRRLLSDDLALVATVVATAARRIDQVRLTNERYEVQLREEEMRKLTAEAELRALRAQINPHFLFNALTTIGYLIESAPARAMNTLMQLTALLRGVLRSEGDFTTLGREIELVEHYLKIEHERFEERLRLRIDVPQALRHLRIPALVVQPLVENAIKHGVAPSTTGGEVEVTARRQGPAGAERLQVSVRNTGAPLQMVDGRADWSTEATAKVNHVGVDNVRRRLAVHYGAGATLTLTAESGRGTVAELVMPLVEAGGIGEDDHDAQAVAGRTGRR